MGGFLEHAFWTSAAQRHFPFPGSCTSGAILQCQLAARLFEPHILLAQGMYDRQLEMLTEVLKKKHIWALNIGENFNITMDGWQTFTDALCNTAVSYMYVSEHHLMRTNLKTQMRDAIRKNRE